MIKNMIGMNMLKNIKPLIALSALVLITACGGGGDGGTAAPVASSETFSIKAVRINGLLSPSSNKFTISGTLNGAAVTGSGSVTSSNLSAGTFEGLPALQRTTTATGSYVANGVTYPLNSLSITWVDSNYEPKGSSNRSEYGVITGTPSIPTKAKINDSGTLFTFKRYTNSTKAVLLGTKTVSYVMEADTASTALLTIISVEKNTSNITTSTNSDQLRITPTGTYTPISETVVEGTTSLIVTY